MYTYAEIIYNKNRTTYNKGGLHMEKMVMLRTQSRMGTFTTDTKVDNKRAATIPIFTKR